MVLRGAFIFLAVALALNAQGPANNAWELTVRLSKVKRHVAEALQGMPDYTCVASFDRYNWQVNQPAERKLDTVKVEVAYVGRRELYSWPGEGKFSEIPLSRMVGAGMIGDGDFAVHAHNLFVGNNGVLTYAGEEERNGRRLWRWDYSISPYQSGWTVSESDHHQLVGSAGSFWVDEETLDLVRIHTRATDFLAGFPLKEVTSGVDYARVQIGEQAVLLPVSGELKTLSQRGDENRNVVAYSNCHQFTGESTISFDPAPVPANPAPPPPKLTKVETQLPRGVALQIRLSGDLNLASASIGDPIEGVLSSPARDGKKEVAPRGSVVHGRLRMVDAGLQKGFFEIGIVFDQLEFAGLIARFTASLQSFDTATPGVRMNLVTDRTYVENTLTWKELRANALPGTGVFFVNTGFPILKKGTVMTWITQ